MKYLSVLKYLILILLFSQPLFAGNVTVTLVGVNPLTVNIKGDSQDEEAASLSVYIYYDDDGTTSLTTGGVDASAIETGFGWGTSFETISIENGSYSKGGHTYAHRLLYDNADIVSGGDDYWTYPSGINALVITFTSVGSGDVYIELNGADGIADWSGTAQNVTFANQSIALPVELNSFNAKVTGSNVDLLWKTSTERNNYGFEVERKANDNESASWEKIGFVNGNGNSNSPKDYSFTDKNVTGGSKFSYRLKQIDNNGTFSYSSNVDVAIVPDKFELFQNYPNPFNPSTTIKFSLPQVSRIVINIYNILGEKVAQLLNADYKAGYYKVQFNSQDFNLASGVYFYTIESKNFKAVKKMVLMK